MGAINPIGLAVKGGYTQPSAITLKGGYTAPTQAANNNSFYAASSDTCNISPLAVQGDGFTQVSPQAIQVSFLARDPGGIVAAQAPEVKRIVGYGIPEDVTPGIPEDVHEGELAATKVLEASVMGGWTLGESPRLARTVIDVISIIEFIASLEKGLEGCNISPLAVQGDGVVLKGGRTVGLKVDAGRTVALEDDLYDDFTDDLNDGNRAAKLDAARIVALHDR